MAESDVTIVVRSRDLSDPAKVRQKWRATGQQIEQDSRASGEKSGKSWLKGFGDGSSSGDGLGSVMSKITGSYKSAFSISAKSAATAFSAQFLASVGTALVSGTAKLAHGLASISALLPAIAVTGVTAFAAMKLAVVGVGDALSAAVTGDAEEFKEAIKGLSPAAREFAGEVRGMRSELKGLQQSVQQSFFEQLSGDTKRLGATYLPMVRSALSGIAGSFGKAAHQAAGFLTSSKTSGTLAMTLGHVRAAVSNVAGALPGLVRAFVPLVAVGSTFLPQLTSGFKRGADELARMAEAGQKSGGIADFIQGGIDKLKSLWDTAKQVGRIIGNVVGIFREFGSVGGGAMAALGIETGGLLDGFEQLTERAEAFFSTGAGGAAITQIFGILHSLLNATFGLLAHLVPIIGEAFAPIVPELSKFAEAIANLQFALADALAPALSAVADLLGMILPPITAVMNVIADSGPGAAALAGEILGLYAAYKVFGAAAKLADANLSLAKIGMAGAASAAGGLALALIAIDAERHAKEVDAWVESMVAADGAVTDATKGGIYLAQIMGGLDERMGELIDSNPRVAQSILDNYEAFGLTAEQAARYQVALDETTAATDNATDAITRQADALRAMTDPIFGAIDAQENLADAQKRLEDLEKSGTASAADLAAARQDVVEAAFALDEAQLTLAAGLADGTVKLDEYLAGMKRQVKQGKINRADYNASAEVAVEAARKATNAYNAIPKQTSTTISANTRTALNKIGEVAGMLTRLNGRSAYVSIFTNIGSSLVSLLAQRFAHGGITGAAAGGPRSNMTWVGEQGPELLSLPPGSHVSSNADSMRMAGTGGGGGGSPVFVIGNPSDSLGRAITDWLRDSIRDGSGGDVQRALGWG